MHENRGISAFSPGEENASRYQMNQRIPKRHAEHAKEGSQCVECVVFAGTPNYTIVVGSQVLRDIVYIKVSLPRAITTESTRWDPLSPPLSPQYSHPCFTFFLASSFASPTFSCVHVLLCARVQARASPRSSSPVR